MLKSKRFWSLFSILAALAVAFTIRSVAQAPGNVMFRGFINDYAPGGPWEVHGDWNLRLIGMSGQANFSAALTMERSDYWVWNTGADPNDPSLRNPHTHHITMTNATVTPITGGFRLSGPATVTGNGGVPPFGTSSTLQVDIVDGSLVRYSNIMMTFGGDAAKHFGTEPLHGAVRQ